VRTSCVHLNHSYLVKGSPPAVELAPGIAMVSPDVAGELDLDARAASRKGGNAPSGQCARQCALVALGGRQGTAVASHGHAVSESGWREAQPSWAAVSCAASTVRR